MTIQTHLTSIPSLLRSNSCHQQGENTISTATEEITQLKCQLMEKLNERSTALANGAQFDLALRDAEAIQSLNRSSSIGYLKAGYIYQQQGRQKEAVAIYQEGLSNVPSSDACYTHLQMQNAEATNAANKRIDFMSRLPLELVVAGILPWVFRNYRLEADVRCPYLYVSRTWRQRILNCNNLSFGVKCGYRVMPLQFRELERFAAHVKNFWMEAGRTVSYEDPLLIFGDFHFSNLTHFTLFFYGYEDYMVTSALQAVHPTLTHLYLYTEDNMAPDIHLAYVLDHCPNLVALELTSWTVQHLTVQYPKLTHLALHVGIEPVPYDTMTNVLSHLPSLVFLDLFPVPGSRFLTSISQHCPHMKLLKCSGTVGFDRDNYHCHLDGLQKLSFGFDYDEEPYNANDLLRILLEHRQSLDHITLHGSITDPSTLLERHKMDSTLQFGRLEHIEVAACNMELVKFAAFIISRSPHLHRIEMDHYTVNNDGVCSAVTRLRNVRKITARNVVPDSPSFEGLLHHHAQLAMNSPLKELEITFGVSASRLPWVSAVARLESLEKLVLSIRLIEIPSTYVSIIGMLAKGCPSLVYLDLESWRCTIPDGAIAQMKHHPTLQRLRIHASSISDSDIISLLSFPNLKHVIIVSTVKDYLFELLQKHIPHVEQRRW